MAANVPVVTSGYQAVCAISSSTWSLASPPMPAMRNHASPGDYMEVLRNPAAGEIVVTREVAYEKVRHILPNWKVIAQKELWKSTTKVLQQAVRADAAKWQLSTVELCPSSAAVCVAAPAVEPPVSGRRPSFINCCNGFIITSFFMR